jgi:ribonucleotide monophosphatase NagD (HAD superfamily)
VLERLDVAPEATAFVGDRPATDVAMGQSIGATGILVLSGATSAAEAAVGDVRPDHTLDSIRDLIP